MDERQRRNWKPACGCGQAATWSGAGIAIAVEIAKQVIKAYRSKQLLWDLFGHRDGTIAFTTIDGTKVFGSNSTSPAYSYCVANFGVCCEHRSMGNARAS